MITSGCVLKAEPTEFPDGLEMECERKRKQRRIFGSKIKKTGVVSMVMRNDPGEVSFRQQMSRSAA